MNHQTSADPTVDMPYTFGRDVETYVNTRQHARLLILRSRIEDVAMVEGYLPANHSGLSRDQQEGERCKA